MAPRDPTGVEDLRELARYIDPSLQPTLSELPALFAATVYGDSIKETVSKLRQEGASDASISHEVSHVIAPPDPEAGAVTTQGVPVESHQALQAEVEQLKQLVGQLHAEANPQEAHPPVSVADQALQDEVNQLRGLVDSLSVQAASQQHPTASSEPVPSEDVAPPTPPRES
jgi:ABC-type Na+ efflux pump permease subunit